MTAILRPVYRYRPVPQSSDLGEFQDEGIVWKLDYF